MHRRTLDPVAVDPPELILDTYDQPILGWLAFGWLVGFVAVLATTSVYETRLWSQQPAALHRGRRLLPVMAPDGSSMAAPRSPWPWAWSDEEPTMVCRSAMTRPNASRVDPGWGSIVDGLRRVVAARISGVDHL